MKSVNFLEQAIGKDDTGKFTIDDRVQSKFNNDFEEESKNIRSDKEKSDTNSKNLSLGRLRRLKNELRW